MCLKDWVRTSILAGLCAASAPAQEYLCGQAVQPLRQSVFLRVDPVQDTWARAAALVDALDADGYDVTVAERWVFMYDPRFSPDGREDVVLRVLTPAQLSSGDASSDAEVVVRVDDAVVTSSDPGSR